MALPAIAVAVAKALPKIAQGAGKYLKKGQGLPPQKENKKKADLSSPRGFVMMSIGLLLDFMTLISAVLILFFGVGLILAKIVYFIGLGLLFFFAGQPPQALLKRQWKKLAFRFIPLLGDAVPGIWTWTFYSALKS